MTSVPDVFDPRQYAAGVPYDAYRVLRDHHPVARQDEHEVLGWPAGPGFWAVTRHADVVRVLKDSATYSSHIGATQIRDPDPDDLPFIRRMMLNQDPPGHGRLRRLVSRAFTPRRIDRFERVAHERARTLLAHALEAARATDGTVDLVGTVTDDYALLNLADLLGVPEADRKLLLHWTQRVIGYQDPDEAGPQVLDGRGRPVNPRSPAMLRDMFGYARQLAAHKRRFPDDDVMTTLALPQFSTSLEPGGAPIAELAEPELEMFFFLLTVAGNDTVRSAAPGGLLALAEHPESYERLRTGEAELPAAVDELLRWHPPVLTFRRTAAVDTELAGRHIRAGDKVVVFHASANRDERVFTDPDRLDLSRAPNPHVSFGDGPHVCLGAHFARLQLRVLYREAMRALPVLRPAGPPERLVSNFINGIKSLPMQVT
ncbi:cytochrome P450 [Streptomyces chartreusis]|uniref:cytochrome P450 n=1 Tax=Streptomyces chartreusis TaxID=1969 RepID=UPI00123C7AA6|nr:cytochrome P450 [Streptomyces chartreusis]QEV66945.1 cytochrome P450 [Streptomyces chartreusis]GGX04730.1 cytochrome P450 [Streptomyces chartreusis]